MSRPLAQIRASRLIQLLAGRESTREPYSVHLTFGEALGPAHAKGREVAASLTQPQLAAVLAAIPKGWLTAEEKGAFAVVTDALRYGRLR